MKRIHDGASAHFTRRRLVQTALALGGLTLTGGLAGCGDRISKRFSISAALSGSGFEQALRAVAGEASDAVLIAVRLTKPLAPEASSGDTPWMYLFASRDSAHSYTVFPGEGEALAAAFEPYALTDAQWEEVPAVEAVALDADAAYARLVDAFGEELAEADDCLIYLMTYVAEDEDPLEEAMKWYFEFGKSAEEEIEGTGKDAGDEGFDVDSPMSITTYSVDAITGVVDRL